MLMFFHIGIGLLLDKSPIHIHSREGGAARKTILFSLQRPLLLKLLNIILGHGLCDFAYLLCQGIGLIGEPCLQFLQFFRLFEIQSRYRVRLPQNYFLLPLVQQTQLLCFSKRLSFFLLKTEVLIPFKFDI